MGEREKGGGDKKKRGNVGNNNRSPFEAVEGQHGRQLRGANSGGGGRDHCHFKTKGKRKDCKEKGNVTLYEWGGSWGGKKETRVYGKRKEGKHPEEEGLSRQTFRSSIGRKESEGLGHVECITKEKNTSSLTPRAGGSTSSIKGGRGLHTKKKSQELEPCIFIQIERIEVWGKKIKQRGDRARTISYPREQLQMPLDVGLGVSRSGKNRPRARGGKCFWHIKVEVNGV